MLPANITSLYLRERAGGSGDSSGEGPINYLQLLRYLRTVAPIKYGARSIVHLAPDDTYLLQRDLNPSAIDFFFKKKNRDTTAAAFS